MSDNSIKQDLMFSFARGMAKGGAGCDFVYCKEEDKFYVYTEGYWKMLFEVDLLSMINYAYPATQPYTFSRKKQILSHLMTMVAKNLSEFNTYDLLNFNQGMVDAKGNNVLDHDPKYLSTLRLNYKYDMLATCPLWLSTLSGIFEKDNERISVLQEYIGYCLTRSVTREKALLLLGESRSGKSTILDTINHLLGEDNVSSVPLEYLANPQYTPMLINKMINIDWDVASGAEKFEANFKIITSGEPVSVNQKFVATFKFRPYCKLIMAANRFPRITDHSSAFYKRLILLPCDRVFEPHEQDINLKLKLLEELPGIFNWAMQGLERLEKRSNFDINKKFMTDALEELRDESNPVDVFFRETVVPDVSAHYFLEKKDLYNKYRAWCVENGNAPMANNKFGALVFTKYSKFTPKTTSDPITGARIWRNLRYRNDNTQQGQPVEWQN